MARRGGLRPGSAGTRAKIAEVVEVCAIGDVLKAETIGELTHLGVKFGFAVPAAVRRVCKIAGVVESPQDMTAIELALPDDFVDDVRQHEASEWAIIE